VNLPVMPPVKPMLSKLAREMPEGDYLYEPKWDGFRCIVFRDGDEVVLGSRNEKPLTRYFPDVVEAVLAEMPDRCVVDGEIILATQGTLDFDALQMRIHPAESRVKKLAAEIPAGFVAFDLLALGDRDLRAEPFAVRRAALAEALSGVGPAIHLTPSTADVESAQRWFQIFEGAGLDGVIAKPVGGRYQEDKRVLVKIKHERVADCVVAGFRWHKSGGVVGSLLLGLFDDAGHLHHVGVTASFTMQRRADLVAELEPYRIDDVTGHPWEGWAAAEAEAAARGKILGGGNRWNANKDMSWVPLRADLVCEVAYDHMQGVRFRHATTFKRWRPDRDPSSCRYDQLESAEPADLATVFAAGEASPA
jgi:ATP-dependent DNA ligase